MHGFKVAALGLAALAALSTSSAQAAVHVFDLDGKAGTGLLAGNENGTILGTPGSGGEVGAGISYDDVTNQLTINIAWGSGNGFTDLTGTTIGGHIHGPTSPAPAGFTQDANVVIGLDTLAGWNSSASNGGFSGVVPLTAAQELDLLAQRYYINVHTSTNSGGEIRGHLVVPEPASLAILMVPGLLALRRRSPRAR